jgi:hypothetical protein
MVDTNQISKAITLYEKFFEEVKEHSHNEGDVERAAYGLLKVKFLLDVLKKYEKNPQNKLLKQIDAGFVSVTRGVEFFIDYETNKKFYELSENIPAIKSHIK